jgi:hypothetical protein
MMHSEGNPWSGIKVPETGFNGLRVDPTHLHDFFWGKDTQGHCLLLLEIAEQLTGYLEKRLVELRGVKSDIRQLSDGKIYFIICLQHAEDVDIFYRLCTDLIDRTRIIVGQKAAIDVIHMRLKRWKAFLSSSKNNLLTAQEVQGLFAELDFLHSCLITSDTQTTLIEGWQGPLDGPHDFVFGDYAVEIKSVSGSQKNHVRISSENQLVTHLDSLFLHVIFLAEFHDCKQGISLNQIVANIRKMIFDADNIDLFDSRLHDAGYIELREYDIPSFSVTQQKTYLVKEDFPRITPETLCNGLTNVSYDISLLLLESYLSDFPYKRISDE